MSPVEVLFFIECITKMVKMTPYAQNDDAAIEDIFKPKHEIFLQKTIFSQHFRKR